MHKKQILKILWLFLTICLTACDRNTQTGTDGNPDASYVYEEYWQLPDKGSVTAGIPASTPDAPIDAGLVNFNLVVFPPDGSKQAYQGSVNIRIGESGNWQPMERLSVIDAMVEYDADLELPAGKINIQFRLESPKYKHPIEFKNWTITVR